MTAPIPIPITCASCGGIATHAIRVEDLADGETVWLWSWCGCEPAVRVPVADALALHRVAEDLTAAVDDGRVL